MNAVVPMRAPAQELVTENGSMTAADVRARVNLVQEVMKAVMKEDVHFGVIPGCKQPSLYKAGSEVLLSTFRIAVSIVAEDLSTDDCVRYRVRTIGTHQGTGTLIGEGIGECSSNESKYKWRRCYIKQEFEATPENRRRMKFAESKNGKVYENMEVRVDPADVANTILKMAKKRAQIDMTLTATAASDIFTQDIEDMPGELFDADDGARNRPGTKAVQGTVPADSPERDMLIANMRAVADNGTAALESKWKDIGKDNRRLVADKLDEFKAAAAKADAAAGAGE
ncbi:MAG: hypothetical protein ACREPX_03930 [Rhodanobacteraceae bacterium]